MSLTDDPTAATAEQRCEALIDSYRSVRSFTEILADPLEPEDMVVQTMPEISPTKWHLAHTTWFFETFILKEAISGYVNPVKEYAYLFNSYYQAAGPMHCRARRGVISRPTVRQVFHYRKQVDEQLVALMQTLEDDAFETLKNVVTVGLHHEQQHQELMLTDIKNVFSENPLKPAYQTEAKPRGDSKTPPPLGWKAFDEGIREIGYGGNDFHYDNERPRHRQFLRSFALADRLSTCGEYLEFIEDGGYERPEFWLSLGWATVQEQQWKAPLYWTKDGSKWKVFTLGGEKPLDPAEPVCHVSLFEAAAFARWAGKRLPEESEWEVAANELPMAGNFVGNRAYHPLPLDQHASQGELSQVFGDVWEWTRTSYAPYPGYEAAFGAMGEYNGKFMCNQYVLRGGSCASSESHLRTSYRNFFQPDKRWQFSGIRLAKDVS